MEKNKEKKEFVKIKNWYTDEVIFESSKETIREAILEAIEKKIVLTRADLTGAVLTDAVLTGADLTGAVLTDAVLTRAVLTGADLTGAVLTDAVLTRAVLTGADLTGADLTRAVLTGADLTHAVLTGAYYWSTNFKYCKVTKKVKEKILEIMRLVDVEESDSDVADSK